jgi:hypothetical protein
VTLVDEFLLQLQAGTGNFFFFMFGLCKEEFSWKAFGDAQVQEMIS